MYIPAKENNRLPMTVGDLKRMLVEIPDDAIVHCEGCDCTEKAYGLDYDESDGICEISRMRG